MRKIILACQSVADNGPDMRIASGAALLLALASCASKEQRLSRSIYLHEQAAAEMTDRDDLAGAAAQQRAAAQDREKLQRTQGYWRVPGPY